MEEPSNIQVITFDLGEVLVKLNFSKVMGLRKLAIKNLDQSITSMNHWPLYDAFERGTVNETQFLTKLNDELGTQLSQDAFREVWNSVLEETVPGMERTLEKLCRHYRLFALTNSNETHINHLFQHYPWTHYFQSVLTSYQLGCRKPERAIYEKLITITGVQPQEILFLDDRVENVLGAKELGIQAELCQKSEIDLPKILRQYRVHC